MIRGADNAPTESNRARMKAVLAVPVALCLVLATVAHAQIPAPDEGDPVTYHRYSYGRETRAAGGYTGIINTRPDRAVNWNGTVQDGCDEWFSGRPLYQTQWVIVNRDAGNWLELGTGHQCSGQVVYRFAGYGYQHGWNPGWISQMPAGTEQIYVLVRETLTNWTYQVAGARVYDLTWGVTGSAVETGLEVYRSLAIMPPYTNRNLDYTRNNGPFTNWAGRDAGRVDSNMCGRWLADDQWRAGANASCA